MAIDTSTINIDFEVVRTKSCKFLKVLDLSHWANAQEDVAYISITTPGSTTPITFILKKGAINIFNAANLQLSDITDYSVLPAIPDGIYEISISECVNDPQAVTHYHLQDCLIRCALIKKLISIDLICEPCRKELLKEIQEIMLFLDGAQAQTDNCNVKKAMEYYRRAQTLLDRITDSSSPCSNC